MEPIDDFHPPLNLEVLFSSPFFWKPAKLSNFLKTCHNYIKEKGHQDEITTFKHNMNEDSNVTNGHLWYPHDSWEAALGSTHFDLVTTKYFGSKKRKETNLNTKSVTELLRIIRNKLEHNSSYEDAEKEELGWFQMVNGKWEFDNQQYSQYWSSKFPTLFIYLWEKFKIFRKQSSEFSEFYPTYLEPYTNNMYLGVAEFIEQLFTSFNGHLEQGGLEARYKIGQDSAPLTLQLRSLPDHLIQQILNGSTTLKVVATQDTIFINWYENLKEVCTMNYKSSACINEKPKATTTSTIFVTISSSTFDFTSVLSEFKIGQNNWRLIIFGDMNDKEKYVKTVRLATKASQLTFSEFPLTWDELSNRAKNIVENCGKLLHSNRELDIKAILPECKITRDQILSQLKGDRLNEILKAQKCKFLDKIILPKTSELYIERQIYKPVELTGDIFKEVTTSDIFVITNISEADEKNVKFYTFSYQSDIEGLLAKSDCEVEVKEDDCANIDDENRKVDESTINLSDNVNKQDNDVNSDKADDSTLPTTNTDENVAEMSDDNSSFYDMDSDLDSWSNFNDNSDREIEEVTSNLRVFRLERDTEMTFAENTSRINVTSLDIHDTNKIYEKFPYTDLNIHCLRYVNASTFQYSGSKGSTEILEKVMPNGLQHKEEMSETEFLQILNSRLHLEKKIFILDKPGMGKSQVLISLAKKIEQDKNRLVLFSGISPFTQKLQAIISKDLELQKGHILTAICELHCSYKFEENLLTHWLTQVDLDSKILIDIMLDGLDEVDKASRDLAFKVLDIIQIEFVSLRIWITARDYLTDEVQKDTEISGYKLVPFSDKYQVEFLVKYWTNLCEKEDDLYFPPTSEELQAFASKCLDIRLSDTDLEIAGIPLQCRMIGEIHEQKILDKDLTLEDGANYTLTNIYNKLIEKKFQVYLKDKKNLNLNPNDSITNTLRDKMEISHIYYAIKLIFSEEVADPFKSQLLPMTGSIENLQAEMLEYGIIQNFEPLTFTHRTFAEFLVSRFVHKVFNKEYRNIRFIDSEFLEFFRLDVLEVTDIPAMCSNFHVLKFLQPTLSHFLNALCEDLGGKLPYEIKQFLNESDFSLSNLFSLREPWLGAAAQAKLENLYAILLWTYKEKAQLFITAVLGKAFEFCKVMMEKFCIYVIPLQKINEHKLGILHWAVVGLDIRPAMHKINDEVSDEEKTKTFIKFTLQWNDSLLEQKDAKGRTPLLFLLTTTWHITDRENGNMDSTNFIDRENSDLDSTDCIDYFEDKERMREEIRKYLDFIKYFVTEFGADTMAIDNDKNTVLHITHEEALGTFNKDTVSERHFYTDDYLEILGFLMEHGCNSEIINSFNSKGQTPLVNIMHELTKYLPGNNYFEIPKAFSRYGADFNLTGEEGNTCLHVAIELGFGLEFIKVLIECGADTVLVNKKGQCALHLAVEKQNIELVKMLMEECKVDISLRGKVGKTIMDYSSSDEIKTYIDMTYNIYEVINEMVEKVEKEVKTAI